jgi:hypothetical protein
MAAHQSSAVRRFTAAAAGATMAAVLVMSVPATATAGDEEVVGVEGTCSGSTTWTMAAAGEDGRIQVRTTIVSGVAGQKWRWVLRHDGSISARGKSKTKDPLGSFEVKRKAVDAEGTDRFRFRAVHRGGDETCVARVRY